MRVVAGWKKIDMGTRYYSWNQFRDEYINQSVPGMHTIPGDPWMAIYADPGKGRIGLQVELLNSDEIEPLPLKSLDLELNISNGKYLADFSTSKCELYEHFYTLIIQIANSIQLEKVAVQAAINNAIEQFRALLEFSAPMSEEMVVGLWGELWLLNALIDNHGPASINYWKGPEKGIHDFQIGDIEIEVKTTRNEKRQHLISSITQLTPSLGFQLYICSIQVEESHDGGESVRDLLNSLNRKIDKNKEVQKKFDEKLAAVGWKEVDAAINSKRYYLRSDPALILVDSKIPRITFDLISSSFGSCSAVRIDQVSYRLDVTGLEGEFESPLYKSIIGDLAKYGK